MNKKISILIITMNRFDDLGECINLLLTQDYNDYEILILDNGSDYDSFTAFKSKFNDNPIITIYRSEKNLGVSGGRNFLLKKATGNILFTIDDDAFLYDKDSLIKIENKFKIDTGVEILAFKSINYYSKEIELGSFPSKNKNKDHDKEFIAGTFIGVAHAFKKEVIETIGLYNDYFPYGMEEVDFSLRALDANFCIKYYPKISVFHKKTNTARLFIDHQKFLVNQFEKRITVAIRNLPWLFVITTFLIRGVQYTFIKSKMDFVVVPKATKIIFKNWKKLINERKTIKWATCWKGIIIGGPVIY